MEKQLSKMSAYGHKSNEMKVPRIQGITRSNAKQKQIL